MRNAAGREGRAGDALEMEGGRIDASWREGEGRKAVGGREYEELLWTGKGSERCSGDAVEREGRRRKRSSRQVRGDERCRGEHREVLRLHRGATAKQLVVKLSRRMAGCQHHRISEYLLSPVQHDTAHRTIAGWRALPLPRTII